jgi:transposase InsO family protein
LVRNPKKRPRSSWRRFAYARPRDCYQQDATEYVLADTITKAVIFDVLDDCTRRLAACVAHPGETAAGAIDAAQQAVARCGAPALWLTDNGTAFTARLTNPGKGISAFTRVVTGFGSRLIHSSPYHPQTCGKIERHHQTLKKWLRAQPPPATIEQLQTLLDAYRDYYNNRRHSALPRRMTPAQAWASAHSLGGPTSPPQQTDATLHRCVVDRKGKIRMVGTTTSVGTAYAGTTVTAIRDGDHATIYTANGQPIGRLHLDPTKRYAALTQLP